jgi:electron transfer flavoprotein alpha subunit
MSSAKAIVAINTDPDAPIFKVAHLGIVGDFKALLPRLIEKCREAAR